MVHFSLAKLLMLLRLIHPIFYANLKHYKSDKKNKTALSTVNMVKE